MAPVFAIDPVIQNFNTIQRSGSFAQLNDHSFLEYTNKGLLSGFQPQIDLAGPVRELDPPTGHSM